MISQTQRTYKFLCNSITGLTLNSTTVYNNATSRIHAKMRVCMRKLKFRFYYQQVPNNLRAV